MLMRGCSKMWYHYGSSCRGPAIVMKFLTSGSICKSIYNFIKMAEKLEGVYIALRGGRSSLIDPHS